MHSWTENWGKWTGPHEYSVPTLASALPWFICSFTQHDWLPSAGPWKAAPFLKHQVPCLSEFLFLYPISFPVLPSWTKTQNIAFFFYWQYEQISFLCPDISQVSIPPFHRNHQDLRWYRLWEPFPIKQLVELDYNEIFLKNGKSAVERKKHIYGPIESHSRESHSGHLWRSRK